MIESTSLILIYIAFLALAMKRLMTYLHALQQDDYDCGRLMTWIKKNRVFDKRLSFVLLLLGVGAFFTPWQYTPFIHFAVFAAVAFVAFREKDPRKDSKKKLAMTTRAKRIFFAGLFFALLFSSATLLHPHPWVWLFAVQMILPSLLLGSLILWPIEQAIQQNYWNEAKEKMALYQPTVIGITGSFGKTSVKHILGHILKMQAPTLITPGSVNTPMGITRIIREQLEENHKYFVVEMGAYGPGSIELLCRLTPPDFGLITAIGHAHYERFKSLDTVAKAKYELAEAVLERSGKMIVHERTLRFDYARQMKSENNNSFIVCGESVAVNAQDQKSFLQKSDVNIQRYTQSAKGLEVYINWKNTTYIVFAPLFGTHHAHNLAMAFVTALELGLEPEAINAALAKMPQIEHRLQVKRQKDGTVLIDDAFNSNPLGFSAALEILALLSNGKRGILITPGMVELGTTHDTAHHTIGSFAGECCDVAIVIQPKRIPTFIEGFKKTGSGKKLIEVESFAEAAEWLEKNKQPSDVVLIENDLPDIYENIPRM